MQYTERVRERTQREPKMHSNIERARERMRAPIHFPATESSDPDTESSEPKTHSNTQRVRERTHYSDLATDIDLPHASDAEFSQTITAQTNARSRPTPEPAHIDPDQRPIQLSQSITSPATPITEPNTDSW